MATAEMIIKQQRNLRPAQAIYKAVAGVPQVLRCATYFKNWPAIVQEYVTVRDINSGMRAIGRCGFGLKLWEPSDVQTLWAVFCNCNYRVADRPNVALDLGANIGIFSIYAAKVKRARKIIALEPVAGTFAKLRDNVNSNALNDTVTCIQEGIGDAIGRRSIYCGVSSPHSSMYYRGDSRFESGQTETIQVTTLEGVFDRFGLESVDVCKADCEGAEVEALLSASDDILRRIRCITMEYHFPSRIWDQKTFFSRLEQTGFKLAWHSKIGRMATFLRK